ncbi:MAG: aminopeptidase P N-terminal domain-containing protein, partial [Cellulosilyticaceae bacterium]
MSPKFFVENRRRLMETLPEDSITILFAGEAPKKSADEYYPFTPNRHFYYLCGIAEAGVKLMLVKEKGTVSEYLFIQKSDPVREKWVGKTISVDEAKAVSGVTQIAYFEDFEAAVHRHLTYGSIQYLCMDFEREGFDAPESRELVFANAAKVRYPFVTSRNIHEAISRLRMVKSEEEIALLREAIQVTDQGIQEMMKHAKEGMYEYELEAHFDYVLKSRGIKDYAFKTIAASGANATVLHYEANNSQIP